MTINLAFFSTSLSFHQYSFTNFTYTIVTFKHAVNIYHIDVFLLAFKHLIRIFFIHFLLTKAHPGNQKAPR